MPRLDDFGDGTAAVRLVAVSDGEQGKGHGRALAEMVERFARDRKIRTLYVNAAPDALGYYESLGWTRHAWGTAERRGIASDSVQMRKQLD